MRIAHSAQVPSLPADASHFDGPVHMRNLGAVDAPAGSALIVTFEPGARTHWHHHPDGQLLYGLEGAGHVATRDGETVDIGPGDLVYAPPGEVHWHGASADAGLTHLALSFGETAWMGESPAGDD
jgi:quercetin dioxygenase-like cupin family protein